MNNRVTVALQEASKDKLAVALTLTSFVIVLLVFIFSTIVTMPGNSLSLWWNITPDFSKAMVFLLAASVAVLVGLQTYLFRQRIASVGKAGVSVATFGAAFFAALVGSATCLSCLAVFLGFLGTGTLIILMGFQPYIMVAGFLVLVASIYIITGPIAKRCKKCST